MVFFLICGDVCDRLPWWYSYWTDILLSLCLPGTMGPTYPWSTGKWIKSIFASVVLRYIPNHRNSDHPYHFVVIVALLTTWEAHHSPRATELTTWKVQPRPRAKPEGCGELARPLFRPQWLKFSYQFLLYYGETNLMINKLILPR